MAEKTQGEGEVEGSKDMCSCTGRMKATGFAACVCVCVRERERQIEREYSLPKSSLTQNCPLLEEIHGA